MAHIYGDISQVVKHLPSLFFDFKVGGEELKKRRNWWKKKIGKELEEKADGECNKISGNFFCCPSQTSDRMKIEHF